MDDYKTLPIPLASHLVVQTKGVMKMLEFYNQNITIIPNQSQTFQKNHQIIGQK